jgi:uncharacterized membrane protein YfcA
LGNINYEILIFSASGVLIGGQIGPYVANYIPQRVLKTLFGIAVSSIGLIYIFTSLQKLV